MFAGTMFCGLGKSLQWCPKVSCGGAQGICGKWFIVGQFNLSIVRVKACFKLLVLSQTHSQLGLCFVASSIQNVYGQNF